MKKELSILKRLATTPPVSSGQAITADAWNNLVKRVEENDQSLAPQARRSVVTGEFWIQNLTGAALAPFEHARVNGFASTFPDASTATRALTGGEVVLNVSKSLGSRFCAVATEGIRVGGVGRATLAEGAVVFAILSGSGTPTVDGRATLLSSCAYEIATEGEFVVLAYDATSRLTALCYSPKSTSYSAGSGIEIDSNNEISNSAKVRWGCFNGSSYDSYETAATNDGVQIKFSNQFGRRSSSDDAVGGREIYLKSPTNSATCLSSVALKTRQMQVLVPSASSSTGYASETIALPYGLDVDTTTVSYY